MRNGLNYLRLVFTFCTLALCSGCALTSAVMGQTGSIRVIYYAPAWGPNTNSEEVVYFLKQVTSETASAQENRIYLCSVKPDGSDRKEIAWLWKDQPDQWIEPYATAATMEINAATKRAAIGIEQGQRSGIFVVGLDGKNFRSLWPKEWNEDRPRRVGYPTWSPDGKWLAFHEEHDEPGYWGFRIAKFRDDATEYTPLTGRKEHFALPAWSPTGDLIAYVESKRQYLWLMKPDGSEKRDTKQWGRYPRWSPDGKLVALEGAAIIDPITGRRVEVLNPPRPRLYPKWGKNGYVFVGPSGIGYQDMERKNEKALLTNVTRHAAQSALEKENVQW